PHRPAAARDIHDQLQRATDHEGDCAGTGGVKEALSSSFPGTQLPRTPNPGNPGNEKSPDLLSQPEAISGTAPRGHANQVSVKEDEWPTIPTPEAATMKHLALLLTLLLCAAPAAAGELRAGAAVVNINPPEGTPLAGYYSQRGSKFILDNIYS